MSAIERNEFLTDEGANPLFRLRDIVEDLEKLAKIREKKVISTMEDVNYTSEVIETSNGMIIKVQAFMTSVATVANDIETIFSKLNQNIRFKFDANATGKTVERLDKALKAFKGDISKLRDSLEDMVKRLNPFIWSIICKTDVEEALYRVPFDDREHVADVSSLVYVGGDSDLKNHAEIQFTFPKSVRPQTAVSRIRHFFCAVLSSDEDSWDTTIQPLNESSESCPAIVPIEMSTKKVLTFRTNRSMTSNDAKDLAKAIEDKLRGCAAKLIIKQKYLNPGYVTIACCASDFVDDFIGSLCEERFTEGPSPSEIVYIREGATLGFSFKGNIQFHESMEQLGSSTFPFMSHFINAKLEGRIKVVDRYKQKNHNEYVGQLQLLECGETEKKVICKIDVTLPKNIFEESVPNLARERTMMYNGEEPLTEEYLKKFLAHQVGEEWKALGSALNVRDSLMQNMEQQYSSQEERVFAMLTSWHNGQEKLSDKVESLIKALEHIDKIRLAEDLRRRDTSSKVKRKEYAKSLAFQEIIKELCRHNDVVKNWQKVLESLGLEQEAMKEIEAVGVDREKLSQGLKKWLDTNDNKGNKRIFYALKDLGHKEAAEKVKHHCGIANTSA